MNSIFIFTAILCVLAQFGLILSETSEFEPYSSFQNATFEYVLNEIASEPKLANLTSQFALVQEKSLSIEKQFELSIVTPNATQLDALLQQVKRARLQSSSLIAELLHEIGTSNSQSFLFHIYQQSLRIQTEKFDKLLKWIGLEISGTQTGVSHLENYYFSERISIVQQLLPTRYMDLLIDAYLINGMLEHDWMLDPEHEKIGAHTYKIAHEYFHKMIVNANASKAEMGTVYEQVLEKIRPDNRELNLKQRMEAEMFIDLFNYTVIFVREYAKHLVVAVCATCAV